MVHHHCCTGAQSPLQHVHNLPYTAVVGSWPDPRDELDQFEQLLRSERGAPCGHDIERILANQVRPDRRQRAQTALTVMKPGPVLAPVLPSLDQIEFLAEQRMVWVSYTESSSLNVPMRRS